jgi:hypothetical protein
MSKRGPVLIPKSRDRTPDHLFHATLRDPETKAVIARRVLCEIYIPDSHRRKVDIVFHPTPNQIPALQFVPAVSVYGRSRLGRFVVKADEIWHEGATTGAQDGISFIYSCAGSASTLEITNLRGKSRSDTLTAGVFWLTDCALINTATSILHSYTGNVRATQIVKPKFTLRSGARLFFRKRFTQDRDTGKKIAQLVAEFRPKSRLSLRLFGAVAEDMDDMLLLVSLAARRRCTCTGWSYFDSHGNFTRFYRRNLLLPPEERLNLDDCLIPMRSFMKYLRSAYVNFGRAPRKELIRNAIFALRSEGGSVDNQFLRLFAGLESILLHVERVNGRSGRSKLHQKLAYFQSIYNVDLTDLWPLLDSSSGTSLAQIRNRSIHGEYLNTASHRALAYAVQNIQWTLERMLLSVLGWSVGNTNVSKSFLPHLTAYRWLPMRSKI